MQSVMPPFDYSSLLFWTDAHVSPSVPKWLMETYGVQAASVRSLQLREAEYPVIFLAARDANAILISKDIDSLKLLSRLGQLTQSNLAYLWQYIQQSFKTNSAQEFYSYY